MGDRDIEAAERGVILLGAAFMLALHAVVKTVVEIHEWEQKKKEQEKEGEE